MAGFEQFLSSFEQGVAALRRKVDQNDPQRPAVRYQTEPPAASSNEVQIGVGRFSVFQPDDTVSIGLCLNNKTAANVLGIEALRRSVTDLVLQAPQTVFSAWRRIAGDDAVPERFFDRFTLIVEDASPDSCFGLFCLLLRLADIPINVLPRGWVDYVRQWEMGAILIGNSPYEAYGCLHNALVHRTVGHDIARSWLDGLQLLIEALRSGEPPAALSTTFATPQLDTARAFLALEEQAYEESLGHALCVQLSLPMVGTIDRFRLVDAYLAEETIPWGSLKVFARADRIRPFLKSGFTLLAIYRPPAMGEGFDVTISVDPHAGVELSQLWKRLEEKEDEKWGGERPCGNPRKGILGYPGGMRAGGRNAPDQPWYDGGDYTLVAAPRRLPDGRFGSKLNWSEVRETLWEVYQPFRDLKVKVAAPAGVGDPPAAKKLVPLEQTPPVTFPPDARVPTLERARHLLVARWHRPDNTAPTLRVTPTLGRYLAACLDRHEARTGPEEAKTGPVALDKLPNDTSYTLLDLPGGIAVITERGAFVLDAGRHDRLDVGPLESEFCRALRILHRLETTERGTHALLDETRAYFTGKRRDLSQEDLLRRLSLEQVEIALELHKARTAQRTPVAQQFRQALLVRWGISDWLDSISLDIEHIRDVLHSRSELLNSRHIAPFSAAALPLLITVPLYIFLAQELRDRLGWWQVPLFLGFAVLTYLGYRLIEQCLDYFDRQTPSEIGPLAKFTAGRRLARRPLPRDDAGVNPIGSSSGRGLGDG
jgi:hypothetical protein